MTTERVPEFHPLYRARLHLLDGLPAFGISDDFATAARRREWDADFGDPQLPDVATQDRELPGPNGQVRVRIYRRHEPAAEPAIGLIWMHGGGFMYGDLESPEADHFSRQMADRTGAVVISVDYRLCTDTVHLPVPHDDCYAVYTWVRQHAADLGIDPARLAVGGGSAGGNLAASVALPAAEPGQPPWQMLLAYPMLHDRLPDPGPDLAAALAITPDAIRFTPESVVAINEHVMSRPIDKGSSYDWPALAADPSVFPPAYIENSEFDDLRASGEAFAALLRQAGVPVEQVTAAGVPHGHLNAVGSPMLAAAYQRFARRLVEGPSAD